MPVPVPPSGQLRMTFVGATRHSCGAVGLLASHLGLDRSEVVQRMGRSALILAETAPADVAQRLLALLSAIGVTVRLDPVGSPAPDIPVEIALQPLREVPAATVAHLARLLRMTPEAVLSGLAEPTGLILRRTARKAEGVQRRLRPVSALRVAISNPASARYDLFLKAGQVASTDLMRLLRQLGLARCPFSGAVAAALDARTAALLVARHGDCVHALNRDFQRFDLILAGSRGMSQADLADFLATRAIYGRERLLTPQVAEGVRLEAGLSRRAAQQFCADYAQIGLVTRMRLALHAATQDL